VICHLQPFIHSFERLLKLLQRDGLSINIYQNKRDKIMVLL